jgi:TonB family protein
VVSCALRLDTLAPDTPRLPRQRRGALTQAAASAALHLTLLAAAVAVRATVGPAIEPRPDETAVERQVRHIVFAAPERRIGGGGGGGGNRQPGPIRRAQGVGEDRMTLRVRKPPPSVAPAQVSPPAVDPVPLLPSVVLEAKPLASGLLEQVGLPVGGTLSGTSAGSGSGGGVGTGTGTGIGSGRGPGLGPGSGGGTGGGVYRPGGAVSAPRLVKEVKPTYTPRALLDRIQGTVVLEAIVTRDGCASSIRVVGSLDRGGLDEEAIAAVVQWRFEPGRLAGAPVDVMVTIIVDFMIR